MTVQDPFAGPTPVASKFASVQSFYGRLVLIEPTKLEHDVPKSSSNPTGPKGDRVTATITTVDGQGGVEIFANRTGTGQYLEGPEHRGVWVNQDRLVPALMTSDGKSLLPMVLARVSTFRGGAAAQGNPYSFDEPTEDDKQMARDFLAGRRLAGASAPSQPAASSAPKNPFG